MASGSDLLRMLEPAVRPSGSPAPAVRGQRPIERRGFDQLLAEMRDRPVTFSEPAQQQLADQGVQMDEAQRSALQSAADRAEASGAKRPLMLMDGMGLVVDLSERTVRDVLDEAAMGERTVTGIDSALRVDTGQRTGNAERSG